MAWPWTGSFRRKIQAKVRSDAIDRQILEDSERRKKECSILLLGAHESGKSTIVKQMKIWHQGFEAHELAEYRTTIYRTVLDSAATLARVVRRVGVRALEEDERAHAALLLAVFPAAGSADTEGGGERVESGMDARPGTAEAEAPTPVADKLAQTSAMLTPALADAIWHVARTQTVERLLEHPTEFHLMDNASYFFAAIHRIAAPTYVPSEDDILHARASGTAILETRFSMGGFPIRMIDVGQRSERRKWIHCFESVTCLIFCAALSDYDEVLVERRSVNRLRESVYLFDSVINSRWFHHTSVVLFLTKIDVFRRKLPKIPLERYFPEYQGGNDVNKAAKFILWTLMQTNHARLNVYPYLTQTTDTNNVRFVFSGVKETILPGALMDSRIFRNSALL
ncbi:heterotrimeric G-protein alpha subunit, GPA3-like protein [Mycena rebaudengoi]|nr:heterotrimeric G-protein alpha subunit, GPA3-like protein [Mycena rebaudengoi]